MMTIDSSLPPLPVFRMKQVFETQSRLVGEAALPFYTDTMTGDLYECFVEACRRVLPGVTSFEAVESSCRCLLGKALTQDRMRELSWRLAGNIPRLARGLPALPWTTQYDAEWVPTQITRVWPHKTHKNEHGYICTLRVLAGTACPMLIQKYWSKKACAFIARKIGFTRHSGPRPYQSSMLLVGLRMCVLLEPKNCRDGLAFEHVTVPSFCITHNTQLLKARIQRKPPCPNGFTHPCFRCAVGYTQCPYGTHRDTFFTSYCPVCKQDEATFDPEMSENVCRKCAIAVHVREDV